MCPNWTHCKSKVIGLVDSQLFYKACDLPMGVEGVTIPNDNGTFDIYINDNLDNKIKQRK